MQCGPHKTMLTQRTSSPPVDPFAAKRAAMREEFFARLFLLGGRLSGTDTYKRTMWAAVPDVAVARAGYALTMRKGLPEVGADNQLIMAGHEAMLAQWFHRPLLRAGHPGDQGPAHEAGDAARRGIWAALRARGGLQPHPVAGTLRRRRRPT